MPAASWSKFGLLSATALLAVLVVGQLPRMEHAQELKRALPAAVSSNALTDSVLVGAFAEMGLKERLKKIRWDHGILSVDLIGRSPDLAMTDMRELVAFAFGRTANVRQVLIRVFPAFGDGGMLLLSAQTNRSDWSEEDGATTGASGTPAIPDADFSRLVRLSITSAGQNWIEYFAK